MLLLFVVPHRGVADPDPHCSHSSTTGPPGDSLLDHKGLWLHTSSSGCDCKTLSVWGLMDVKKQIPKKSHGWHNSHCLFQTTKLSINTEEICDVFPLKSCFPIDAKWFFVTQKPQSCPSRNGAADQCSVIKHHHRTTQGIY